MSTRRKSQVLLGFGGLAIALLLAAVFTLGSLTLPYEPRQWDEVLVLYALSTFIVAALLVFGLILTRSLLRLWTERRAHQPGSRFKTKMVLGAIAVSFLPVVFMFFVSYALLNRTLVLWFPRPLEMANQASRDLINEIGRSDSDRMTQIAQDVAGAGVTATARDTIHSFDLSFARGADLAWATTEQGNPIAVGVNPNFKFDGGPGVTEPGAATGLPVYARSMPSGAELWQYRGKYFLAGRARSGSNFLLTGRNVPDDFPSRIKEIETQTLTYGLQRQQLRTYKSQMLLTLLLFTILLMFSATWFALFLSKQVTVPIQALAEATQEIIAGNFETRVNVQAQDELETLVRSFNRMTEQLGDNRRQIDLFTHNLQQAVQELERRRTLMETILENIPTGVISVNETESIVRINPAAVRMFGESAKQAENFAQLLGEVAARSVHVLMRRSLRLGTASQELEFTMAGRLLHAAVTVSSLGPRRTNRGYVVVVDDLTDLLRAQKAAAWQEVAQRIAHEIKNPLTPIRLAAERMLKKHRQGEPGLARAIEDGVEIIVREVATLQGMVDEFSRFARMPRPQAARTDVQRLVAETLHLYQNLKPGVEVEARLDGDLTGVTLDAEQIKRALINLLDNAVEATDAPGRVTVSAQRRDGHFAIKVADTGRGIPPEAKEKLFLPYFSTKGRGTGLGLAIVHRIVADHHGSIRVEDNHPRGTVFTLELPGA